MVQTTSHSREEFLAAEEGEEEEEDKEKIPNMVHDTNLPVHRHKLCENIEYRCTEEEMTMRMDDNAETTMTQGENGATQMHTGRDGDGEYVINVRGNGGGRNRNPNRETKDKEEDKIGGRNVHSVSKEFNGREGDSNGDERQEEEEEHLEEAQEAEAEATFCGVPHSVASVVFLAMLESWNMNTIWPFLPSMVARYVEDERMLGYSAGFVGAAFFAGQAATGYLYGRLADAIGRRPVLLAGTVGTAVSVILFGFAPNLPLAVLARFFSGALNGNTGVCRTYIGEAVSTSEAQARAFSSMAFLYGLGAVVAPGVGASLSEPAERFPRIFGGTIFETFPYALPMCFSALLAITAFCWGYVAVPETKAFLERNGVASTAGKAHARDGGGSKVDPDAERKRKQAADDAMREFVGDTLASRLVSVPFRTIWIYAALGLGTVANDELGPLFLKTGKRLGGLGFEPGNIATVMTCGGVAMLIYQLFIFTKVVTRFGAVETLRIASALVLPIVFLYPTIGIVLGNASTGVQTFAIATANCISRVALGSCYPSSFILTNNSCPNVIKGRINGAGQTAVSIVRMLAPVTSGATFAFSMSLEGDGPLHDLRTFVAFALVCFFFFINFLISQTLPSYLDKPFDPAVASAAAADARRKQRKKRRRRRTDKRRHARRGTWSSIGSRNSNMGIVVSDDDDDDDSVLYELVTGDTGNGEEDGGDVRGGRRGSQSDDDDDEGPTSPLLPIVSRDEEA